MDDRKKTKTQLIDELKVLRQQITRTERSAIRKAARKKSEEALRESEERLRFALETSHTGAWDLDLADHTAFRSREHDRIFGYAELLPQWTYEMFLDHVLPEDRAEVDSKFRHATATQSDWSFECRIMRADGEVRWIWAAGRHRIAPSGGVRRMAGIVQDITGRKRAEEALRESECRERERAAELATLLDAIPTPVFIAHDPNCLHITGNCAADDLLRNPHGAEASLSAPDDIRPRHFKAVKDGRDLNNDELPAQRAARGIPVRDFEFSLVFADGTTRHVMGYGTPLWDEEKLPRGAVHVLVDITERKRAEEALRESEEQFRSLADSIPNLAWWANGDGYITWYNKRWYEYTGTTPEQMEGWGWQSVHDPEVLPKVLQRWKASIATGEAFDMDFPLRGADGVFRSFLTRVLPVKDSTGKVLRWFGTNTDISMLKRAEEEKNHALKMAQERTAELEMAIGELEGFTYSVSHDLRAPIRHMASYSALLQEQSWAVLDEDSRKFLNTIIAASKRMGILVDALLDFSKMGRKEILQRPVELGRLIQEIVDSFASETKARRIKWRVGDLPEVYGDLEMLRLVFINLISNAIKFTRRRSEAYIEIGYTDAGDEHVIHVRDNGVGFDMAYYDKLFGVFHRLHGDNEFEGTGIGLANVQRIAGRHKGKVWAEGKVDEGATFYISLPKNA